MSALRRPAYTSAEISDCLRLALASSPLAQPPEANWRCRGDDVRESPPAQPPEANWRCRADEARESPGVTCPGDELHEDR